jgi:general secretion pathway protein D
MAWMAAVPPLQARNRRGDRFMREGKLAEANRHWDEALDFYEKALAEDPTDPAYQMSVRRVRFQAGQKHVEDGLKLREQGKIEEAAAEFQRAYAMDPSSSIAAAELKRTLRMIQEARKKAAGGETDQPAQTPAEEAREQLEERIEAIQPAPELRPMNRDPVRLTMNNQPVKVLFETVAKLAGINVIFDAEYQSTGKNYSVDLNNTTLEQALDHIGVITKSFWKALSPNTVFVTNDNPTKRRDHEDMVVKSYYIKNITTPQELQEISTILRSVCDIRRVFTYNSQNVIVVRGEVDKVALADKLVADLDKPRSEVVVDVLVMEASRVRTRDLAATLISGDQQGLRIPITFSPRPELALPDPSNGEGENGDNGSGQQAPGVRLSNLSKITTQDFAVTLPGALLQALMSDRGTRVLQSPQVRATDTVKSSLRIGDRFPYATGSFQPGVATVGVSPLVSTQFQFADVGVNVDITPKIHGYEEVSLTVEIEISQVRDRIDVGGLSQPVIGQRKVSHNVRLRTGEVSVLGGLLQDQDTKNVSGVPGVGHVPVLKRLFTGESTERNQGELLIVLVPHIVRAPDISDVNLRGVAAGTETTVKLNYAPRSEAPKPAGEAKPAEAPKLGAPGMPIAPLPAAPKPAAPEPGTPEAAPAPAAPPATVPPTATVTPPVTMPPGAPAPQPPPEAPKPAAPAAAAAGLKASFQPGTVNLKLSAVIPVTLQLEGAKDIAGAPLTVRWDPKVLRLNEVTRGNLLSGDGQQPIFTRNIRNEAGEANILLNRLPGTPGVSGSGALVTLVFQAVGKGSTQVTVPALQLRDSQMQPVGVTLPALPVTVE